MKTVAVKIEKNGRRGAIHQIIAWRFIRGNFCRPTLVGLRALLGRWPAGRPIAAHNSGALRIRQPKNVAKLVGDQVVERGVRQHPRTVLAGGISVIDGNVTTYHFIVRTEIGIEVRAGTWPVRRLPVISADCDVDISILPTQQCWEPYTRCTGAAVVPDRNCRSDRRRFTPTRPSMHTDRHRRACTVPLRYHTLSDGRGSDEQKRKDDPRASSSGHEVFL